jgi:hypothetical protein
VAGRLRRFRSVCQASAESISVARVRAALLSHRRSRRRAWMAVLVLLNLDLVLRLLTGLRLHLVDLADVWPSRPRLLRVHLPSEIDSWCAC